MTDLRAKAERPSDLERSSRLAEAERERMEAYRRYAEAWDAMARTTNGTLEDERARAAVVEAERAQTEAEKRLQAIEAEP